MHIPFLRNHSQESGQQPRLASTVSSTVRRVGQGLVIALATLLASAQSAEAGKKDELTLVTYNIKFLSEKASEERIARLQETIRELIVDQSADVFVLQEIKDEKTLQKIFPKGWKVVMDDDEDNGPEIQNIAFAVSPDVQIVSPKNGEPDRLDFLYPHVNDNDAFPNRRDIPRLQILFADRYVQVLGAHLKAAPFFGTPSETEDRRIKAAEMLVKTVTQDFKDQIVVFAGDMNARFSSETVETLEEGGFAHLTAALAHENNVSFSASGLTPDADGHYSAVIPGIAHDTITGYLNDERYDAALIDQVYVHAGQGAQKAYRSSGVHTTKASVEGGEEAASDHYPVHTTIDVSMFPEGYGQDVYTVSVMDVPGQDAIRITSLLPDPEEKNDRGYEQITFTNSSNQEVSINGWYIVDARNDSFELSGTVEAGESITITLPSQFILNNDVETISLYSSGHQLVQKFTYEKAEPGKEISLTVQ